MLQLTPDEQTWLDAYRQSLQEHFPELIEGHDHSVGHFG